MCSAVDPLRCATHWNMPDHHPRIDATDVVRIQLTRIEQAEEPVLRSDVSRVGGYSHAGNLMQWAYRQGLIAADKTKGDSIPHDASVTPTDKGVAWLDKYGRRTDPDA